jgi:hypothetical protein
MIVDNIYDECVHVDFVSHFYWEKPKSIQDAINNFMKVYFLDTFLFFIELNLKFRKFYMHF